MGILKQFMSPVENFEVEEPPFLNCLLQLKMSLYRHKLRNSTLFLSFFCSFLPVYNWQVKLYSKAINCFPPLITLQIGTSFDDPSNPCVSYTCNSTGLATVVQNCPKQTWCTEVSHDLTRASKVATQAQLRPLSSFCSFEKVVFVQEI